VDRGWCGRGRQSADRRPVEIADALNERLHRTRVDQDAPTVGGARRAAIGVGTSSSPAATTQRFRSSPPKAPPRLLMPRCVTGSAG
jgi:hypothetical protein